MNYDESLQTLVDVLLQHGAGERRVVVVRDVQGRLRVCVDGAPIAQLEDELTKNVGKWFAPPLLSPLAKAADERFAAEGVLEEGFPTNPQHTTWPNEWPQEARKTADGAAVPKEGWRALRPVVAKGSWLDPASASWASLAHSSKPVVIAFHSFKGGVGRTTALSVVAHLLVKAGQSVVAIDLDVEAPGLHHVFGVPRETGALDLLLEHQATDSIRDISTSLVEGVEVLPAGAAGPTYLERLGHLDFAAPDAQGTPAAGKALDALLAKLGARKKKRPNIILLDTRAGLHDIGALAMQRAHIHVLVARASEQGLDGLRVTLDLLKRSTAPLIVVQNLAAPNTEVSFRAQCHSLFANAGRFGTDDAPEETDDTSEHFPAVIPVLADGALGEKIRELVAQAPAFQALFERIQEKIAAVRDQAPTRRSR